MCESILFVINNEESEYVSLYSLSIQVSVTFLILTSGSKILVKRIRDMNRNYGYQTKLFNVQ